MTVIGLTRQMWVNAAPAEKEGLPTRFVGRRSEIATLKGLLAQVTGGVSRIVEVTGEPGIGKTRLLAEFARLAAERGLRVFFGKSTESDRYQPLAPLMDALEDHRDGTGTVLRGRVETLLSAEPKPHRAVRQFLQEVAGTAGVALFLDDLHWADECTTNLLAQLVRRAPRGPVLIVLAYRHRQAPVRLYAATADAGDGGPPVCRLPLGPLSFDEVETLLGARHNRSWRRSLYRESGGNPFYLDALARGAAPAAVGGGDDLPPLAQMCLLREAESASPLARLIMEAAAVTGDTFSPEIVAALAGRDQVEVLTAIDELVLLDLVRPVADGQRFAFRHSLIRQAVYATTSPGWRRSVHGRAIAALRHRGAAPTALAHHLERAADPGDLTAVAVLHKAAVAVQAQSPATAVAWLRAALRLLPDQPGRNRSRVAILIRLAHVLGVAGRLQESRDTMHEALHLLPRQPAAPRAHAVAFCVLVERLLCRRTEADALLRAEIEALPPGSNIAHATLKFELACSELAAGRSAECVDLAEQALAAARRRGLRTAQAAALGVMTMATAAMARTDLAATHLDEASNLLDSMLDGEFVRSLNAAVWVIWGEVMLERWDDALRHLGRAISFARRNGQALVLPHLYAAQVLVLRVRGRLRETKEAAQDGVDLATLSGSGEQVTSALTMQCLSEILTGDVDEAVRAGTAAAQQQPLPPSGWCNMLANRILAEARLAAGDPAGCLTLVQVAGGDALPYAESCSRTIWYEILTRAELALGHTDAALRWAELAEQHAAPLRLSGRTGLALLARAQVQVVRDPGAALSTARRAAEALERGGMVLDATRARMVGAVALAAQGHIDDASAQMRGAQTAFMEFGAQLLARQAMVERRRLAARQSRRGNGSQVAGLGALTRREQQVASLVSEGLTNRRIAQRLSVTEKTVEMHLAHIFSKLGVSSRVAVARMVDVTVAS